MPLRLPRQGRSLTSTPPASRPQRSGLATQLRFTQPLFVTLFGKLEIHHLMHTRLSSLIGSICPFAPYSGGAEFRYMSVESCPIASAGAAFPVSCPDFTFAIALRHCLAINYLSSLWMCNDVGGSG